MNALVVNCSKPHYNLGARKLADWLEGEGHVVTRAEGNPGLEIYGFDVVALSVIFSWHAPIALDIALRVKSNADVWCGGPGMTLLRSFWLRETGLEVTKGIDARFERQRGDYLMTFASRGCPVGCWFCVVPRLEGSEFSLDWEFSPSPILCDNNLSALPVEFQSHIIRRYQETGTPLKDANSGFEPNAFDEETRKRWEPILRGPWRYAYDEIGESEDVRRVSMILRDVPARRKQVYVLVGNEPVASCLERALKVIGWGGEPYCQYVKPLNWLGDAATLKPRFDWTTEKGRDFCRFFNRHLWRSFQIEEYRPRLNEACPFGERRSA